MHAVSRSLRWAATAFLAVAVAQAQESGFSSALKLRVGQQLTSQAEDTLDRRMLGFGLALGYTASFGTVELEAGFQYKSGTDYTFDLSKMPLAAGAAPVDPANSADVRKDSLQGLTARLSFQKAIPDTDFSWQVGVQVGGAKFKHTYAGDVGDTGNATYEDTYNGQAFKSALAPSPFAGITYRFSKESALEVNLLHLAWTAVSYRHVAGTVLNDWGGHTAQDGVTERSRRAPHLELAYVFRF